MKIAAFPKGDLNRIVVRRDMTVFEWIEQARTLGVDGLEMHTGFFWEADFPDRVGDALAAADLAMPMMCASPDFTHPDPAEREREIAAQAEAMRITRLLGGPGAVCRVLSGQRWPQVSVGDGLDRAAEAITSLLPLAAELDITLAIENHYKASTWTYPEFAQAPEVFRALVERIDDRVRFGVQYDPSNALVAGADPAEFLAGVVDRVVTMQASDRYLEAGASLDDVPATGYPAALKHGVIGRGLNDYDRIFPILVEAGYDGWISIEDGVNGLDEMRASVEFLKTARERWFDGSTAVHVRTHEEAKKAWAARSQG
ncbi:sugar phosphate isomerase/epimerase family protein [Mangrovihabitans endophyticus]|uniref:Myo-inositol catabolism protein IolH n=1 Tax=Mangrovihabitans endophyticus TaxID=1751298 RepID=A0A8J3BY58_9ACTN|nr:sugar phosphate isomerase/epimerase family protein [Mangrovihabitans endophyticus]GGK81634.1 myo-inositol catabolism protein IolH [Mangrovihabitans endophyticus]